MMSNKDTNSPLPVIYIYISEIDLYPEIDEAYAIYYA